MVNLPETSGCISVVSDAVKVPGTSMLCDIFCGKAITTSTFCGGGLLPCWFACVVFLSSDLLPQDVMLTKNTTTDKFPEHQVD